MKKHHVILLMTSIFILTGYFVGCQKNEINEVPITKTPESVITPGITLYYSLGCKKVSEEGMKEEIKFEYTGNTLFITHINARFSCNVSAITPVLDMNGNTMTIRETETVENATSHCLCYYDIKYKILSLPARNYTLHIESPLPDIGRIATSRIDLDKQKNGIIY